jgi:nucleolar protein 12
VCFAVRDSACEQKQKVMVLETCPFEAGQLSGLFSAAVPVAPAEQQLDEPLQLADVCMEVEDDQHNSDHDADMETDKQQDEVKEKKKATKEPGWKERDAEKTIFLGNVPLKATSKDLKKLLVSLEISNASILSMRFRSVPIASLTLPRKVAIAQEKYNLEHRNSKNAYVVFKTEEDAQNALQKMESQRETMVLEDKHLRFDAVKKSGAPDNSKCVFLGNLAFDIEEEDIREHFQHCGTILDIRVIRDRKTNAGKGFAYVRFAEKEAIKNALLFNDTELKERKVRVKKALDDEKLKIQAQRKVETKGKEATKSKQVSNKKKPSSHPKKQTTSTRPDHGNKFQGIEARKDSTKLTNLLKPTTKKMKATSTGKKSAVKKGKTQQTKKRKFM